MIRPLTPEPPEPLADFLDYLKSRVIGDAIVHHQLIPPRPEHLAEDLGQLPPLVWTLAFFNPCLREE